MIYRYTIKPSIRKPSYFQHGGSYFLPFVSNFLAFFCGIVYVYARVYVYVYVYLCLTLFIYMVSYFQVSFCG